LLVIGKAFGLLVFNKHSDFISARNKMEQSVGSNGLLPPIENPFKMPPDSDILMLREKEKQLKLEVGLVF
jgi:hypothetical protein